MTMQLKSGDSKANAPHIVNFIVQIHGDVMDWEMIQAQSHLNRIK